VSERAAEHNYRMALMFYRTERYEDAIAILDDLALEFPDNKHVLYALTKCFFKVGRYQEARQLCHELLEKHHDERAQTLLERIGNRKDAYRPESTSREAPPELPAGVAADGENGLDSPPGAYTPVDDTSSSWMSSTPTGLFADSPTNKSHGSGGYSSPAAIEHPSSFSTPPPLPHEERVITPPPPPHEERLITPPPLTHEERLITPPPLPIAKEPEVKTPKRSDESPQEPSFAGRNLIIGAIVTGVGALLLWLAFGPRQFDFPEDHSLGTIVIREIDGRRTNWKEFGEAKSHVGIPRRAYIGLVASKDLSEADLALLRKASWLKHLDLSKSEITDELVEYLVELRQLESIDVRKTGLTKTGIVRLQEWLPHCKVLFDVDASAKAVDQKPNPPPNPKPEKAASPPPPPSPPPAPEKPAPAQAPQEQPPGPRNLVFGDIVGDLFLRAWNAPEDADWQPFRPAKGRVAVDAGQIVKLHVRVGPSQFSALRHLNPADIHTLDVSAVHIEDQSVPYIARLTGLRALNADNAEISANGLQGLCALSELRELTLAGADKFDAGAVAGFPSFKKLERLVLRGTNVTDESLRYIGKLSHLRVLDLTRSNVGDAGLAHLTQLDKLAELALAQARVEGPGLVHLASLDALERLDLIGNPINGAGLAALGQCKRLAFLQLDGANITDDALMLLAKAPSLKQVQLINTRVSPQGIETFKKASPHCAVLATNIDAR